jgi:hypothetical protein
MIINLKMTRNMKICDFRTDYTCLTQKATPSPGLNIGFSAKAEAQRNANPLNVGNRDCN